MILLRRMRAVLLISILTAMSANFHALLAQSQLEFSQKILYSDSLFANSNTLNIRVLLKNNSNSIASNVLLTYSFDSLKYDTLLLLDTSANLAAKAELDTFLLFTMPTNAIGTTSNIVFEASTSNATISKATLKEEVFFNVLAGENPKPILSNYVKTDYKRFNEYLPIEFELKNKGKVDYFTKEEMSVLVRVNNKSASIINFKIPSSPLLAQQKNSIKFKDSILVSNQFFKKGGGNIVVVWPVGFLQIDSIFDTLIVDWTLAQVESPSKEWSIYPNPTSSELYVLAPFEIVEQVRIIDSKGQVFNVSALGKHISLSNLNPGIYTLCIFHEQKVYRRTFIIAK